MRIVQVCVRFGAPGGAEAHVAAISRELAGLGHEVVVHTSDLHTEVPWRKDGVFEAPPEGVSVVRHPMEVVRRPHRRILMRGLREALVESRADVFHGHSHRYLHLRAMASAARATARPWCVTPHYHPIEAHEPGWKHVGGWAMDRVDARLIYRGASRVFTVTDLERRFIAHLAPPGKMVTIPNGIDLGSWQGPHGAAPHGSPYVAYAGRLASNKGLAHLLDAWAGVAKRHPSVDLILAGRDWGVGDALRGQARALGIEGRVRFVGHLDDATYRATIANATCLVLPSEWEAFGIVLLEAMACGVPVVATRVGGVPEVVAHGEDGLLVPYGDPDALGEAIARVIEDETLARRMGARGRDKASAYDWPVLVRKLERELRAAC